MKVIRKNMAYVLMAALVVSTLALSNANAAKKPALNKKSVSISVGKSVKVNVKNAAKNAKVRWKTNKKSVAGIGKKVTKGKKAYATIIGVSAGSAKITAVYKAGKVKKNLTCKVTVTAETAETTAPVGTTTKAPEGNTPVPEQSAAPEGNTPVPEQSAAPATDAPDTETTTTIRPTRTPRVTAQPATASPVPTQEPDASGKIDNSKFSTNSDGIATVTNDGKLVVNDTRSEGATEIYLPLPSAVSYGETITVVMKGTADSSCPGFRVWIGNGAHRGMETPKSITNLSANFNETFTLTAFTAEQAGNHNIGAGTPIDVLTIKSTSSDGPVIKGLTIESIDIYYTGRGATVGENTNHTPSPTDPSSVDTDVSGPADLSAFTTVDNASTATFTNGKLIINDTRSDTSCTEVHIPLPGSVKEKEKVTVVFKGTSDGTTQNFRTWIGHSGGTNYSLVKGEISNLPSGNFVKTFEFEVDPDRAKGDSATVFTIKSQSMDNGPAIKGITVTAVEVYYTDRGATVPTT